VGQGLLIVEVSRSHSDTPLSVGLLQVSDRPISETTTKHSSYNTILPTLQYGLNTFLVRTDMPLRDFRLPTRFKDSFDLLRCHAALIFSYLPTFRDNLSVPYSRVKQSTKNILYNLVPKCSRLFTWSAWHLKMGMIGCPETSVNNYQPIPRNKPEERRAHTPLFRM
jgi:hypothetical protein